MPVEVLEVVAGHVEPGEVVHGVEDALDLRDGVGVEAEGAHVARALEGPPGEGGDEVAGEVQDLQVGGAPESVRCSSEEYRVTRVVIDQDLLTAFWLFQ